MALRKELTDAGFDAGAETIRTHLARRHRVVLSTSTIWRVLKARGFVIPQPHKRPTSSYTRFVAELPNECWQGDVTHVEVADGVVFEVLNVIDDHSRLCVANATFCISVHNGDMDTLWIEDLFLADDIRALPANNAAIADAIEACNTHEEVEDIKVKLLRILEGEP